MLHPTHTGHVMQHIMSCNIMETTLSAAVFTHKVVFNRHNKWKLSIFFRTGVKLHG